MEKICPFGIENGIFLYDDYKGDFHITTINKEIRYPSVFHALLSFKTDYIEKQREIATTELPAILKEYERSLIAPPYWKKDFILDILETLTIQKFSENPALLKKLLATGDTELKDAPITGTNLFGIIDELADIENYQGKNLMKVRHRLRNEKPLTD